MDRGAFNRADFGAVGGYMLPDEAARYLGVNPSTLNRWRSEGRRIPYHKLGGRVSYLRADLDDFLARTRVEVDD